MASRSNALMAAHLSGAMLALSSLVTGCDPPAVTPPLPPTPHDAGPRPDTGRPPGLCDELRSASVSRQAGHPGRGIEIDVLPRRVDGAPPAGDYTECITLSETATATAIPACTFPRAADGSILSLLIVPGRDAAEAIEVERVAIEWLAARPASERVAIYRYADTVALLDTFTRDRTRAAQRLRAGLGTHAGALRAPTAALDDIANDLEDVEDDASALVRIALVLSPARPLPSFAATDSPRAALMFAHAVSFEDGTGTAPGTTFETSTPVAEVSAGIDAQVAAGFVGIGLCGDGLARPMSLDLRGGAAAGGLSEPFGLRESANEDFEGMCDGWAVASGARTYPRVLEFVFDDAQRATYQRQYESGDRTDFPLSFRMGEGGPLATGVAHFRGQSSFWCERRNFTLDLDGGLGRVLMPGSSSDEFTVVSLCLDQNYIHYYTVFSILAQMGLFPIHFDFFELRIDGVSQGVYFVMEKVTDELRRDHPALRTVFRRAHDTTGSEPALEWAAGTPEESFAAYHAILQSTDGLSGEALEAALRERMDLDAYLRWIALMTALENGDYVDEVYFFSTPTRRADGSVGDYFSIMPWDPDDAFSTCHHAGMWAVVDPNGLLYCTESALDHIIFADPHVYGLYVDTLEGLLTEMDEAAFARFTGGTRERLLPFFESAGVRAASVELLMREPGATERDVAVSALGGALDALDANYARSRTQLLSRIATLRSAP